MRHSHPKRYVLYEGDRPLSREDVGIMEGILEGRHGKLKLIPVKGSPRHLVGKTSGPVALAIRERSSHLEVAGTRVAAVLTSGSIGKLKRRAEGSRTRDVGQVLQ